MAKAKEKSGPVPGEQPWGPWELASDRDGVKVEIRKNPRTGILQTRTTGVVGAPTDEVWDVLTSPEGFIKMMGKCLESRHFETKPKLKQEYVYQRLSGGVVSERDYTLLVRWTVDETKDGKRYHRWWSVDNDKGPEPRKGVVRVAVNDGSWVLTPLAGKKTSLEQVNYIELGGSLPTMLANGAIREAAGDMLKNLRKAYPPK